MSYQQEYLQALEKLAAESKPYKERGSLAAGLAGGALGLGAGAVASNVAAHLAGRNFKASPVLALGALAAPMAGGFGGYELGRYLSDFDDKPSTDEERNENKSRMVRGLIGGVAGGTLGSALGASAIMAGGYRNVPFTRLVAAALAAGGLVGGYALGKNI